MNFQDSFQDIFRNLGCSATPFSVPTMTPMLALPNQSIKAACMRKIRLLSYFKKILKINET